jgi:hypothetical protein
MSKGVDFPGNIVELVIVPPENLEISERRGLILRS